MSDLALPYPSLLPLDVALWIADAKHGNAEEQIRTNPPKELLDAHGLSVEGFVDLWKSHVFQQAVKEQYKAVIKEGLQYKFRARAMSEEFLGEVWRLVKNEETSSAVRMDAIKWTAKMAGLEPQPKDTAQTQEKFSLVIQFGGQQHIVGEKPTDSTYQTNTTHTANTIEAQAERIG